MIKELNSSKIVFSPSKINDLKPIKENEIVEIKEKDNFHVYFLF